MKKIFLHVYGNSFIVNRKHIETEQIPENLESGNSATFDLKAILMVSLFYLQNAAEKVLVYAAWILVEFVTFVQSLYKKNKS